MNLLRYILLFFLYVLLQVIFFNKFNLFHTATPHVFLLFLLMLPYEVPVAVLMPIGFFTGLVVDLLSQNLFYGVHSFAAVLMLYLRRPLISLITNRVTFRSEDFTISEQPPAWMATYLLVLIFIHQFTYYLLDEFALGRMHIVMLKGLTSTAYTFFFCALFSFLFYRKSKR